MLPIRSQRLSLFVLTAELLALMSGDEDGDRPFEWPARWPDETDRRHVRTWQDRAAAGGRNTAWGPRAVVDADGHMVGHAGFHLPARPLATTLEDPTFVGRREPDSDAAVEIGYTIFPNRRRRGYATEAVTALVDWAAQTSEVRVLLASVVRGDDASVGVLRRVGGFVEIGTVATITIRSRSFTGATSTHIPWRHNPEPPPSVHARDDVRSLRSRCSDRGFADGSTLRGTMLRSERAQRHLRECWRVGVGRKYVVEPLTSREQVVLQWLATPLTKPRIAAELFLSVNTVKSHVKQIYRKLGVSNRHAAIEYARSVDLLDVAGAQPDFEALVTHSRALITVIDADRKLVWANPAYRDLLGSDPSLQLGRPAWEIVHPDDRTRLTRMFYETSVKLGSSVTFECRLAHADGTWRHVEVHQVNRLHDPAVRGFVGTTCELPRRISAFA